MKILPNHNLNDLSLRSEVRVVLDFTTTRFSYHSITSGKTRHLTTVKYLTQHCKQKGNLISLPMLCKTLFICKVNVLSKTFVSPCSCLLNCFYISQVPKESDRIIEFNMQDKMTSEVGISMPLTTDTPRCKRI